MSISAVSSAASYTSQVRPPSLSAAVTLGVLMHEFGWLLFITPLSLFPMQLLGIIYVADRKSVV